MLSRGARFHGKLCRKCSNTERYVLSRSCVVCVRRWALNFRKRHPERYSEYYKCNKGRYNRNRQLKKYDMTEEQWQALFTKQGRRCAICSSTEATGNRGWQTDHCHASNKTRGILCLRCNTLLGLALNNPKILNAASQYLALANIGFILDT